MFYKNIAQIYARSRPPYPQELFDAITTRLENYQGYIDLGCGTGEMLIPLSNYFENSFGIDPDTDMLAVAKEKINKSKNNIELINNTAEDHLGSLPENEFLSLVTSARSFHWMNQKLVVAEVYKRLQPGGLLVTLGEANGGIWRRKTSWAQAIHKIIAESFPHKETFVPARGNHVPLDVMKENLKSAPFSKIDDLIVEAEQNWNIEKIINLFYSGSGFLEWLDDDKDKFENLARTALLQLNPSGEFTEISKFGISLCKK